MDWGQIRDQGEQAFWRRDLLNPYPADSRSGAAWEFGWRDGQRQALDDRAADEARADQNAEIWRIWNE
jgi:hypothetical protein